MELVEVVGVVSLWKIRWGMLTYRLVVDDTEDSRGPCGCRIVVAEVAVTVSALVGAYL